jgi:hypothetical protein
MVKRVLEIKDAYNSTCSAFANTANLKLTGDDEKFLEQLRDFLKEFDDLTQFISASRYYNCRLDIYVFVVITRQINELTQ